MPFGQFRVKCWIGTKFCTYTAEIFARGFTYTEINLKGHNKEVKIRCTLRGKDYDWEVVTGRIAHRVYRSKIFHALEEHVRFDPDKFMSKPGKIIPLKSSKPRPNPNDEVA